MFIFIKLKCFLLLSFVCLLSCFVPLTCAKLHPDEDVVLRQIAEKLVGKPQSWTVDPCVEKRLPINIEPSLDDIYNIINNTIACNHVDGENSHITSIDLEGLNLQGSLPLELVNLTFLEQINLTRNYLKGTLPKEWASMRHLKAITINANRLTGPIPPEWGNFANLSLLSLEANRLSGTIPEELGNLVSLTRLVLSSNQFVGSLPSKLANIKNMTDFRVSDNSFNGTVPEFIGEWTNLERLEMYSSGLQGPIPANIFALENLTDLRITDMIVPTFSFPNLTSTRLKKLVLRNLNMSGFIPANVWKIDNTLDLTFNKLEGEIKSNEAEAEFIFLSGNMLTGDVPEAFRNPKDYIDLSYNNFTQICTENSELTMYRSFSSNNTKGLPSCPNTPVCNEKYRSLHINCGGQDVIVNNTKYEGDGLATKAVSSYGNGSKWGFISVGDFMDDDGNNDNYYVLSTKNETLMKYPKLYSTARASPIFLTYYANCMENGDYTVNLHFAEILFRDEIPSEKLGRRIFDIYIQGSLLLPDFNIKEMANGTGKEIIRSFNTRVTDNTLEIRLYWAGKGTTLIPRRGFYGPIISAISVCYGFRTNCDDPKETSNLPIVVGVVTSVLFLILCIVGIFCWKRYFGHENTRERDLKGLDLQTGSFTFRQLRAATNNFDSANKIGEGGFGSVYKGQLSDGTIIAVKQLSSKSRQGNREFVNEIGMISGLQHPNLVKLFGCCVAGNQLLLVYEYMENNCLAHALFGLEGALKLDWATRQKICVGIARGLAFLHEESTLKIVHRDIKATNVLLDKELNAKISDFGLAKLKEDDNTHISTRVAGTIGYMAPEYALWGYLTEKADVYSFGVVALEIVSGRNNASFRAKNECTSLLDWAFDLQQKENLMEIVDPKLENEFNEEEAERMIKLALLCSNASPALRPTMSEVVSMLEAQTIIQEAISDPSIYGNDLRLKPLKGHYQQIGDQISSGSQASMFSSGHKTGPESSTTSAHDLYSGNWDSIRNLTSSHDLYPANSETISLNRSESSSVNLHLIN